MSREERESCRGLENRLRNSLFKRGIKIMMEIKMPATPYRMLSYACIPALTQTAHERTARGSVKISKLCVEISKLSVASASSARTVVSLPRVAIVSKFRFLRSKFHRDAAGF